MWSIQKQYLDDCSWEIWHKGAQELVALQKDGKGAVVVLESKLLKMSVRFDCFFSLLPHNARVLLDFVSFSFPVCENALAGLIRLVLFGLLTTLRIVQVLHSPTGHTWKPILRYPANHDELHTVSAHLADVSSEGVRQAVPGFKCFWWQIQLRGAVELADPQDWHGQGSI